VQNDGFQSLRSGNGAHSHAGGLEMATGNDTGKADQVFPCGTDRRDGNTRA
jgi:hypothetical protein